ncbi:unnamed protein product [Boreogadus saida]
MLAPDDGWELEVLTAVLEKQRAAESGSDNEGGGHTGGSHGSESGNYNPQQPSVPVVEAILEDHMALSLETTTPSSPLSP